MNENKCQVVDQQRPFCMIDYAVLDDMRLSGIDLNVYAALKRWANANRECWPSAKKIAEKARTSERSCFRSLKHLEELGYITRRQRTEDGFKKTTVYQIMSSVAVSYCHTGSDVLPQWQEGTASVADKTRSNEQDPENKIHPLDPPEGDDEGEAAFPEVSDPSEADAAKGAKDEKAVRELSADEAAAAVMVFGLISEDFELSPGKKTRLLEKILPRWMRDYGMAAVVTESRRALAWNVEHGGKIRDPVRFIGNWLRKAAKEYEGRGSGAEAPIAVIPRVEKSFAEFWDHWPGLKTGREAARREWYARFGPLAGDTVELAQARSRAYDCLEEQLSGLMERAENGEELRYLGTPAHFIRDADFGERYAGAV